MRIGAVTKLLIFTEVFLPKNEQFWKEITSQGLLKE